MWFSAASQLGADGKYVDVKGTGAAHRRSTSYVKRGSRSIFGKLKGTRGKKI